MFYGYNKFSFAWKENRVWELAEALEVGLSMPIETRNRGYVNDGHSPYIEVILEIDNCEVRIRRITHMTNEDREKMEAKADTIYNKVMRG